MYRNIFTNYDKFESEFKKAYKFEKLEYYAPLKSFWAKYVHNKDVTVFFCDPASEVGAYEDNGHGYCIEFDTDATNYVYKWVVFEITKNANNSMLTTCKPIFTFEHN